MKNKYKKTVSCALNQSIYQELVRALAKPPFQPACSSSLTFICDALPITQRGSNTTALHKEETKPQSEAKCQQRGEINQCTEKRH